jgi:1-pyrroline-5-carboxylate dehydrogenase
VTGNTVVLKPSSDAPFIASMLVDALYEAGVPPEALQFVTGGGGKIGDQLVDDPRVRFVSFTGSREVGTRIYERAAKVQPGQRWLKRVVAEMGGKDAIVVDSECDLDAAAQAIVTSAFGFSGQKCSACSRAILVDAIHDDVLERVVEKARKLVVGSPESPDSQVGPVVNRKAFDKMLEYVTVGRSEGRIALGGEGDASEGFFMKPTIVSGVGPSARLSCEEIFGPILAVTKARSFQEAVAFANATDYGLTGAAWTTNRKHAQFARERFHVGNLYINRKCTGAMVGGHPFGGFNMSGTDSKAGGRDYLGLFLQAKSIAERLIPPR